MPTECSAEPVRAELFEFGPVEGRAVVAGFDGGAITSDAGALLLRATDRAIRLIGRFAGCFIDQRRAEYVEHLVPTLVGQRVFGMALGYEDINDHDELRHDPVMAVLAGKLEARRADCAPVAGKSTLNRLELSRDRATRYHKIGHDPAAISAMTLQPLKGSSSRCSWRRTRRPRKRSSSISTRPTIRCMGIRRGGSFTAITIARSEEHTS